MGSVEYRVIDLQDDGLTVETVLVIEDLPYEIDLFSVLDLVHEPIYDRAEGQVWRADGAGAGSIRRIALAFSPVATYTNPSGPCRTSRMRWCNSTSMGSR